MVKRYDDGAFHMPSSVEPMPELLDDVQRLRMQGRSSAALDVVIRALERDSRCAAAFRLALALCSARTEGGDDITREQLAHPLLAPITTECTRCARYWYSAHNLTADIPMTVSNPIGLQCQTCRYTLCRTCLGEPHSSCPAAGCRGALGTPVLATGRGVSAPAIVSGGSVEFLLILWRGTEPGPDEIMSLLGSACPGQDTDGALITTMPSERLDEGLAEAVVYAREADGELGPGSLERLRIARLDSGDRGERLLAVVTAAPGRRIGWRAVRRRRGWWRRRSHP